MKHFRLLYLLPALLVMLVTCKLSDSPTGGGDSKGNITTTIAGMINDENGQPIEGVSVNANGKTATTNEYGTFMIQNVTVPSSRCFIICKKNGYFTGSRAETPKGGGITELRLTMQSNTANYTLDATSGGKISVGGASVSFPAASVVDANGAPYTGTAKVAAKFLDPTQNSFYNSFSGDFAGKRLDGSQTELLSYGVLRVHITDGSGNELKLAEGKTATLTYPIAASMQKDAPASIPLWYFDETLGIWKEEGSAVKSGDYYTGQVSHFTDWNLDYPGPFGTINGRVLCGNDGVEGILVTVGQKKVVTDKNGYFSRKVPLNIDFTVSVNSLENSGLSSSSISVHAFANGETRIVDIPLSTCPAYIRGTIIDCNNKPIAGTIILSFSGGQTIVKFTTDGIFKLRAPTSVPLSIVATTLDGKLTATKQIEKLNLNDIKEMGQFLACGNGNSVVEVYDISVSDMSINDDIYTTVLSPDGSLIALNGHRESSHYFTEIYETKTGKKLFGFSQDFESVAKKFSTDNTKLLVNYYPKTLPPDGNSSSIINPLTGGVIRNFNFSGQGEMSVDGKEFITYKNDSSRKMLQSSINSIADGSVRIVEISSKDMGNSIPSMIGIREPSQLVLYYGSTSIIDPKRNIPGSYQQVYFWDLKENILTYGYHFGGLGYQTPISYSNDFFICYVGEGYFSNTFTNSKIISVSLASGSNVPIANDLTYIRAENIPTIYDIRSQEILKILPVKSQSTTYKYFTYSANSAYLAAKEYNNSEPTNSVRIWKVK